MRLRSPFLKGSLLLGIFASLTSCKQRQTSTSETSFKIETFYRNSFYYVKQGIDRVCLDFEEGFVEDFVDDSSITKEDLLGLTQEAFLLWLYQIHLVDSSVSPHVTFGCNKPYLARVNFLNSTGRSNVKRTLFGFPTANIYKARYIRDPATGEKLYSYNYGSAGLRGVLNHEAGHLFGLNDTYVEHSNALRESSINQPGQPKSVMSSSIRYGITEDDIMGTLTSYAHQNPAVRQKIWNVKYSVLPRWKLIELLVLGIDGDPSDGCYYGQFTEVIEYLKGLSYTQLLELSTKHDEQGIVFRLNRAWLNRGVDQKIGGPVTVSYLAAKKPAKGAVIKPFVDNPLDETVKHCSVVGRDLLLKSDLVSEDSRELPTFISGFAHPSESWVLRFFSERWMGSDVYSHFRHLDHKTEKRLWIDYFSSQPNYQGIPALRRSKDDSLGLVGQRPVKVIRSCDSEATNLCQQVGSIDQDHGEIWLLSKSETRLRKFLGHCIYEYDVNKGICQGFVQLNNRSLPIKLEF